LVEFLFKQFGAQSEPVISPPVHAAWPLWKWLGEGSNATKPHSQLEGLEIAPALRASAL